jgi:rhamnogalacturonan endolyase
MCGPWFVYLNQGDSPDSMWTLAKHRAEEERKVWPYSWMDDTDYPLARSNVSGVLRVAGSKAPASHALMILTAPNADWQTQILGYNFSVRADAVGRFTIPNVRPGTYWLHAVVPGYVEEFQRQEVTVRAGRNLNLGQLDFSPVPIKTLLWQIGYPDRKTTGFKLSDLPRQYGLDGQVPADLTFTVGVSDPAKDWYYAQAKAGDWNVSFRVDRSLPPGEAVLTIGVAGQTNDPHLEVLLNGQSLGTVTTAGNSSALYRSAVLGSSYYETKQVRFPADKLVRGPNVLTLRMIRGSIMYDTVRLAIE